MSFCRLSTSEDVDDATRDLKSQGLPRGVSVRVNLLISSPNRRKVLNFFEAVEGSITRLEIGRSSDRISWAELVNALPQKNNLEDISLTCIKIDCSVAESLDMDKMRNVRSLHIREWMFLNTAEDETMTASIAQAIAKLPKLERLSFVSSYTGLPVKTFATMTSLFLQSSSLRQLTLDIYRPSLFFINTLLDALESNKVIEQLYLEDSNDHDTVSTIFSTGIPMALQILECQNFTLEVLKISSWLHVPMKYQSMLYMIDIFLFLNRIGRSRLLEGEGVERKEWVDAISKNDERSEYTLRRHWYKIDFPLTVIFVLLSYNPSLCDVPSEVLLANTIRTQTYQIKALLSSSMKDDLQTLEDVADAQTAFLKVLSKSKDVN